MFFKKVKQFRKYNEGCFAISFFYLVVLLHIKVLIACKTSLKPANNFKELNH